MNLLENLFNKYRSDKGNEVGPRHSYSDFYSKYMDKLFKKEYYQYSTQIYSIYLQEYFKAHKIKCFQFNCVI